MAKLCVSPGRCPPPPVIAISPFPLTRQLPAILCGVLVGTLKLAAGDLPGMLAEAWATAEQRSAATVSWMETTYGVTGKYSRFPTSGNLTTSR